MVADETEITVIDLGSRARKRSRPEGPPPGSPGATRHVRTARVSVHDSVTSASASSPH